MNPAPEVIGIGLCTVDMLFVVPWPPVFGGLMRAAAYLRQGGGPVPTALVALARLGARARFIGRVGDDPDGLFLKDELAAEGVDVSRLFVEPGAQTRVALVLVDQATGERGFTARPETCRPLVPADLQREEIEQARVVHLDDADPVSIQAAEWAHRAGNLVVFDGTWGHEQLDRLLPLVDVPIVSEPFVEAWMPGVPPDQVVRRLRGYGARIAVLTLGARGCVVSWDEGIHAFPALPTEPVDTTGAGDAFHGGFIYGLLQEWPVDRTVLFASAVAALNCRRLGGRTGLPDRVAVERFLEIAGPGERRPGGIP
ncbi:MAG: PfkB family carbohydrate kinase [Candidatus Latescibacterota bacterium]|jgi:ribokinase